MNSLDHNKLYFLFIEAIAHTCETFHVSLLEGPIYHNQIVKPTIQSVMDSLHNQGIIYNYVIGYDKGKLLVQIQEVSVKYTMHMYPMSMFSADVITVAGVMMV